ncbi:MAG: FlgD immunoglobulin-like domain containing protein [Candidatus Latescibacterota bacterium]
MVTHRRFPLLLVVLAGLGVPAPALDAQGHFCAQAALHPPHSSASDAGGCTPPAARTAALKAAMGTQQAVVLFAAFSGEEGLPADVPSWAGNLLDAHVPGSLTQYYETMSLGQLHVRGSPGPRWYTSAEPASEYLADQPGSTGQYGRFVVEVLTRADGDIDFSRFDGNDDAVVDAVFVVLRSVPDHLILGAATGIGNLGFAEYGPQSPRLDGAYFVTGDTGADGRPVREGQNCYYLGDVPPESDSLARTMVDRECADGRWVEAGHPLGRTADPQTGGDNLDFWAHDAVYAAGHAGNLGDATDPFDGVRFTAFTPQTNPASLSLDGKAAARVEDVRLVDGAVHARVQAPLARLRISGLALRGQDGYYRGTWGGASPGTYRARVAARDAAGNTGFGDWRGFAVAAGPGPPAAPRAPAWEAVGPQATWPVSARALEIAPSDPQVQYLLSDQGAWRRVAGGAWTQTALPPSGRYTQDALRLHPDAPLTLAYYPDPAPRSVLVSQDGGAHWEPVHRADLDEDMVFVVPQGPASRVYATGEHEVRVSEDGGMTWYRAALPGAVNLVLEHPADRRLVYLQATPAKGYSYLLRSADGGRTWEQVGEGYVGYAALAGGPLDPLSLLAGREQGVRHSADGGITWRLLGHFAGGIAETRGVRQLAVSPADSAVVYAVHETNNNLVWQSRDGGATWRIVRAPGYAWRVTPDPDRPDGLWVTIASDTGAWGLYRSDDSGVTFIRQQAPHQPVPVRLVCALPSGDVFGATYRSPGADDRFTPAVFSLQPGVTEPRWRFLDDPYLSSLSMLHVDPARSGAAWAQHEDGLSRSLDGGQTWKLLGPPGGGLGGAWGSVVLADLRLPRAWFYSDGRDVFYTADDGTTWEMRTAGLPDVPRRDLGGLARDPRTAALYTALGDTVWRSADDGRNWAPTGTLGTAQPVMSLGFHPLDDRHLYAATAGGLYRSADGGRRWTRQLQAGPGGWPWARLRFDPRTPARMYLVAGTALLRSADWGDNWQEVDHVLPGPTWLHDLAFDPADPAAVYVATSVGLFRVAPGDGASAVTRIEAAQPAVVALEPPYPNPSNASVTVPYRLPGRQGVRLTVHDVLGRRVRTLVHATQEPGEHRAAWNGTDQVGRRVGSGVYFCVLQAAAQVQVRRLARVR